MNDDALPAEGGRRAGNVLTRKLMQSGLLTEEDLELLAPLTRDATEMPARCDLISRGDDPKHAHVIVEGLACRYKILPDGRRSIMAFMLPGDFCDIRVAILRHMDHSIGTLTKCRVAAIPRGVVDQLLAENPRIARAFWWATLVDEAVLREWLVNVGMRRANKQMAHLFCELHCRLRAIGETDGLLPLMTLEQMADALGITSVHAQRTHRALREHGLISVEDRRCAKRLPRELSRPCPRDTRKSLARTTRL